MRVLKGLKKHIKISFRKFLIKFLLKEKNFLTYYCVEF
jgi:hypothetical protein